MSNCEICERLVENGSKYCAYHQMAYRNLQAGFENWQNALEIEWDEYLTLLLETEELGIWVQDVIEHIIQ